MIEQFKETFKEEAYELLSKLEELLLELEEQPDDQDVISAAFRAMHTIKGSAAMFGFEHISDFTHEIETIMDLVRSGSLPVTKELINHTLEAKDHIKVLLECSDQEANSYSNESKNIVKLFQTYKNKMLIHKEMEQEVIAEPESSFTAVAEETEEITYRIRFSPYEDIFLSGTNPLLLLNELKGLGECTIIPDTRHIPSIDAIVEEKNYCSWDIVLTTAHPINTIKDIFIFVEDLCTLNIEVIEDYASLFEGADAKRLGEILLERGFVDENNLKKALQTQKRLGEVLLEHNLISQDDLTKALEEQDHVRKIQEKRKASEFESIRVGSEKLDYLVDLVGELVTVQARISQLSMMSEETKLKAVAEELERLMADLRDNAMSLRMVPLGTTFNKYKRLVRDLSDELGKSIDMETAGGETVLDKNVIDKLGDPLVHLVRNCIDHGIEKPEARRALGKKERGTIELSAYQAGAAVVIEIKDDGKGLDQEAIKVKALQKGLIEPKDTYSDDEIFQLIFMPGFSTAKNVTSVSGRGVGMDVVKRQIELLRGTISIYSELNIGTTITLSLPLTLAIIEGLLVEVGEEFFVIPLNVVEACLELNTAQQELHPNRKLISYRDNLLPYIHLRELFSINGESLDLEQVVVVETHSSHVGLVVDQVIGNYQTVIKSLGKMYKHVKGVSGATILGDGQVALILDVNQISETVTAKRKYND